MTEVKVEVEAEGFEVVARPRQAINHVGWRRGGGEWRRAATRCRTRADEEEKCSQ